MEFQPEFIKMLSELAGEDKTSRILEALSQSPLASVRLNPFKSEGVKLPILDGASAVPWCRYGYVLKERPVFTLHPLFHAGVYYVQDSSAMMVSELFRRAFAKENHEPGHVVKVLDLCAAPGGKTTDLAASLREMFGDDFLLVSNEVMRKRASVLVENVAKWGDPNVVVTCNDPKDFSALEGFFDCIVADVPCSGEGMFRKDEEALEQWSVDNVNLCAQRQKRILADVWPALRGDGLLVYSTCTFNKYENDGNVEWMCGTLGSQPCDKIELPDGVLETRYGYGLMPGYVPGEGQYCSAVRKLTMAEPGPVKLRKSSKPDPKARRVQDFFTVPVTVKRRGETVIAVPAQLFDMVAYLEGRLDVIASGCAVGQEKGQDLIPDEDLALCIKFNQGAFPATDLDKQTALSFLHKDTFLLPDAPKGFITLRYKTVPLGFVKNLGTRVNNLHPQGRRIRMDI